MEGTAVPNEQQHIRVTEAVLDPKFRVVEVNITGLTENLIVVRIEHPRLGNVDWIISKPSAMFLRDILNEILAQGKIAA